MTCFSKFAFALPMVGILTMACPVSAQTDLNAGGCQAQLDRLAAEWTAAGLPAPQSGPVGGVSAKAGMIRLDNGRTISVAYLQSMTIQFHEAADACRAGNAGAASNEVALVHDYLKTFR